SRDRIDRGNNPSATPTPGQDQMYSPGGSEGLYDIAGRSLFLFLDFDPLDFLSMLLVATRTDAVGKDSIRTLGDVGLQAFPIPFVVTDLLAPCADRDEAF